MEKLFDRNFFKKPHFYLSTLAFVLGLIFLIIYASNGATQYNQETIASIIVTMSIIGLIAIGLSCIINIRYLKHIAAVAFLFAFLEYIVTEVNFWGNLFVQTDPVPASVLGQYVSCTILILVASIASFVAGALAKRSYFKENGNDYVVIKLFKKKIWETLSVVMASLFVLSLAISNVAHDKAGLLNETFQIETSRIIFDENDDPADYQYFEQKYNSSNIEEYYKDLNIEVENEGLVLLKNENDALPLASSETKLSLVLSGSVSNFFATHGPGAAPNIEKTNLRTALETNGYTINNTLYEYYQGAGKTGRGSSAGIFKTNEKNWSAYPENVRSSLDGSDVALVVITRISGEGSDVSYANSDGVDGSYLSLTNDEISVLSALAQKKADGKIGKIVILLNSAMQIQCDFLFDESLNIDSALWIGNPGGNGMISVAKVLKGEVNPSGRLSDILLKDNFKAPANAYWKINEGFSTAFANSNELGLTAANKYYGVYVEGIYVGYRYFETRYEDFVTQRSGVGAFNYANEVAYPFGYGLSYTTFNYSNMSVNTLANGDFEVKVTVTNAGTYPGKEAVQIYLQQPYTEYDQTFEVEKPSVQLAAIGKTKVLGAGESDTLTIVVYKENLRAYDALAAKTYILDAGDYYLTAAKDSHDAVNNILAARLNAGDRSIAPTNMDDAGNANLAKVCYHADSLDKEIFAKSEQTGEEITNHLDFMDPNQYDGVKNDITANGRVTYVSRFNWSGTFPQEKTALSVTDQGEVKYDLTVHKPIIEDEGAVMPEYGQSNGLTLLELRHVAYDDPKWDLLLDQLTYEEISRYLTDCFGYTQDIPSIVKPYTDEDDGPYGVSHSPYAYSSMSCGGIIASTFNKDLYAKVGEAFAADARRDADKEGIQSNKLNGMYSPGLNIHRSAFGGRASEYFSEDPMLSAFAAVGQIQEMQKQGVIAHPKHYIFNDEESNRNGIGIWCNEQAAREIYLLPWEYACSPAALDENWEIVADSKYGGAHAMMTSFNRAGSLWSSASSDLMFDILRDEWNWDGYAITDMAESNGGGIMAIDDGFMNGTTCFLMNGDESTLAPYAYSPTFNLRVREAAKRMLYVTVNFSSAMNGISPNTRIIKLTPWWENLTNALIISTSILSIAAIGLLITTEVLNIFYKKKED